MRAGGGYRFGQIDGYFTAVLAEAYVLAIELFRSTEARFQTARTELSMGEIEHARGDTGSAAAYLRSAHAAFVALRVPRHVGLAERLAGELGVTIEG